MAITFRPGVKPADPYRPRLFFTSFRKPGAAAPEAVDYTRMPTIGMLGNDKYGCCVYTGDGHTIEEQTYYGQGTEYVVTEDQVLAAYGQMTGFDPGSPATDQGDTVQHGLEFLRKTGFGGHVIAAFAQLDPRKLDDVKLAVAEFGVVAVGMAFPAFAMDQFDAGQPWDVSAKNTALEGGHRVTLVGYDATYLYVLTWNAVQKMTYSFWNKYVAANGGEAWASIGVDWVNAATGKDPAGVDKYVFGAQFAALTGQPNPFPAPAPPTPTPAPQPAPTPAPGPDEAEAALAKAAHKFLKNYRSPGYLIKALKGWLADKSL